MKKYTEFSLPPVMNTGNPGVIPILRERNVYLNEAQLYIEDGSPIIAFFELNGVYHICGMREHSNLSHSINLTVFAGSENIPDEEPIPKGIPFGEKVRFGVVYQGALYEIVPRSIMGLDMSTYQYTKPLNEVLARGTEIVHVRNFDLIDEPIEVFQVPYLAWLENQCPVFASDTLEYGFNANIITHGIARSQTIGTVKKYKLYNHREMVINRVRVKYSTGTHIEPEDASGSVKWTGYRWIYTFDNDDYERGYVTFKQYAKRQPFCGLKSDPFVIVKANLVMIPASDLPPDEVIEPPAPPPPPVTIPDLPAGYTKIVGKEYFSICVTEDGWLGFVNHLNYPISIQLKEVDAPRWILGMGLRANTHRYRKQPRPFTHDSYKGKRYFVTYASHRAGIAGELEFDW